MLEALKEGKLSGFGTDFMLDDPLTGLENIMVTGHSAGVTLDLMEYCVTQLMDNVARTLKGESPQYIVNDVARARYAGKGGRRPPRSYQNPLERLLLGDEGFLAEKICHMA